MAVLITCAVPDELSTLRAFVKKGQVEGGVLQGLIGSRRVGLVALGIGSVEAALTASSILARGSWEALWFVGTAGILPGARFEVGQAVEAGLVMASHAPGERLPGPLAESAKAGLAPAEGGVHVWSSQGVSETRELAEFASSHAAHVENMELWGVARAALRVGVPWGAVLGLSNDVGPQAQAQWLENRHRAAAAACQRMAALLGKD
ncbi:MAG: hypothetical protein AB7F75_03590 [Planctomycetota bacterium]